MNQPDSQAASTRKIDAYALTWRLPVIIWQILFFVAPLIFMVAMSFFLVKNYRMTEAFEFVNWAKMLSRGYFWDSYGLSIGLAALATIVAAWSANLVFMGLGGYTLINAE